MEQVQSAALKRSNHLKLVWGLVCLIAPTAIFIGALLLYAVSNFIFSGMAPASEPCPSGPGSIASGICRADTEDPALFAQDSPVKSIINVFIWLAGLLSVLTWLPGIIVGIILLATRKEVHAGNQS